KRAGWVWDRPARSTRLTPVAAASSTTRTRWSGSRLTSSTKSTPLWAAASRPGRNGGSSSGPAASTSSVPRTSASVAPAVSSTNGAPPGSRPARARAIVDLADPGSPRSSTPPMPGSTAASSSARRASSWPTTALKGKRVVELIAVPSSWPMSSQRDIPCPVMLASGPRARTPVDVGPATAVGGTGPRRPARVLPSRRCGPLHRRVAGRAPDRPRTARAARGAGSAPGGQVLVEGLGLGLQLVDARLHDVADADDAGQPVAVHHRDVADAALRHQPHELGDGRRRVAGREVRGHEVPHRGAQHRGRVAAGQRPDDVALGDDPHHPLAVVGDHERADVVVAQPGDGVGHRRVGRDRRDVPPLAVEDVLDQHGGRLLPRSVVPRRAHLHCPTSRRVVRGDAGTLRGGRSGTPCAAPRASHAGVPTDRLPDHGIDVARARAETPGCEDVVHLDHAGASLPPRAVVDAQVDWLRAEARTGGYALAAARADELEAAYDEVAALL